MKLLRYAGNAVLTASEQRLEVALRKFMANLVDSAKSYPTSDKTQGLLLPSAVVAGFTATWG